MDKLKNTSRTVVASNAELPNELLELREEEIQPIREIYTGRYRTPGEREAPTEMVDAFLAPLQVGCFVAMYFANYDKLPRIGKVVAIEEENFYGALLERYLLWKMDSSACSPTEI